VRRSGGDVKVDRYVRDGSGPLRAELGSYEEFVLSYLPQRWPGWLTAVFSASELAQLEEVVWAELGYSGQKSCLVRCGLARSVGGKATDPLVAFRRAQLLNLLEPSRRRAPKRDS
jgi:hypothetical protein